MFNFYRKIFRTLGRSFSIDDPESRDFPTFSIPISIPIPVFCMTGIRDIGRFHNFLKILVFIFGYNALRYVPVSCYLAIVIWEMVVLQSPVQKIGWPLRVMHGLDMG